MDDIQVIILLDEGKVAVDRTAGRKTFTPLEAFVTAEAIARHSSIAHRETLRGSRTTLLSLAWWDFPAGDPIPCADGLVLARELFSSACELELLSGMPVGLAEDASVTVRIAK